MQRPAKAATRGHLGIPGRLCHSVESEHGMALEALVVNSLLKKETVALVPARGLSPFSTGCKREARPSRCV
jgi:hypothetical protein